jgi:hypothetical protein
MEFEPTVIALEPVVIWRDRDKDQVQVFIDQAMRVPKLLVGIELGGRGPARPLPDDVPSFPNVTGNRGDLAAFPGSNASPTMIRLISTPGFVNLPSERSDRIRVPAALRISRRDCALAPAPGDHALAPDHSGGGQDRARLADHFAQRDGRSQSTATEQ